MRVRLATFNIENLGRRGGDALTTEARRPTLQAQLTRLDADILCLQEVNAQEVKPGPARQLRDLESVLAGTAYAAFHRACTLRKSGVGPLDIHNLVTLSRWPILEMRQLWNDLVEAPSYRRTNGETSTVPWERPILQCAIDLGGRRPLHVINLHLRTPLAAYIADQKLPSGEWKSVAGWAEGLFATAVKRAGQGLEVRLAADRLFDADPEAIVAVAGDFNAAAGELPVRIVRGDPAETGNAALAGRALVPLAEAIGAEAFTVVHGQHRFMLDHILASRTLALACRKIAIDNASLLDETEDDALAARRPGSYHAPVVAEFELP
ncbi:MAG TPA: endonuclease/exonuclease/phosphatase family protein [Candidatus Acidoferrum sp.]|nr:endonuclease/exonuclease/phosphatase family protein [Candidatus Acidoferrum sp.]